MKVKVIATHGCSHRPSLERELADLGVVYELVFVEEQPELIRSMDIRQSPTLVIDDKVTFRGLPSGSELRGLLFGTSSRREPRHGRILSRN